MSSGPKRARALVFVSVKTQFENVGDALIVRELLRLLAERARLVVDVSSCPDHFIRELDLAGAGDARFIRARGRLRVFGMSVAARLRGVRVLHFLIPGGRGGEITQAALGRQRLLAVVDQLYARLGIQICQVGVSYNNLGRRYAAALRKRTQAMHLLAVRDSRSRALADRLDIRVSEVVPDLAFNLFGGRELAPARGGRVAFSFRTDKRPQDAGEVEAFIAGSLEAHPEWSEILLVSQVRRDDALHERLASSLPQAAGRSVTFVRLLTIDETLAAYDGCEAIYSNRLHALLMAASRGVTPVAVLLDPPDDKIRGIFEDFGAKQNLAYLSQDRIASAAPRFDQARAGEWRERIGAFFDRLLVS